MSPFGFALRLLRYERGVPLKTLAVALDVAEKVLSAVETGRRRPLDEDQLGKIKIILHLNEEEHRSLLDAARYSETRLRIPLKARPVEYRLIHGLIAAAGRLSDRQIETIQSALGWPAGKNREGENEMT